MNIESKCWENFKGFIYDYYDYKLVEHRDYIKHNDGNVVLVNKAREDFDDLFDMAYDSWTLALELQEL